MATNSNTKKLPDVSEAAASVGNTAVPAATGAPASVISETSALKPKSSQTQPVSTASKMLDTLPGISGNTRNILNSINSGSYQPSQGATAAMSELSSVIARQPQEFQSQYYDQLSAMVNKLLGREAFSYDISEDPMYRMYRDRYAASGRQAMEDTMGRAAALTGGYGSSYTSTAGQQAYNQHLQELNDRIPELYKMARDTYTVQDDALRQQYEMLNDAYQREYGAYQDEFNRWLAERQAAQEAYDSQRDYDYKVNRDNLERQQELDTAAQQQSNTDREYFYNVAMDMLDMGRIPSTNILRSAGLSEDDITALIGKKAVSTKRSGAGKTQSSVSTATKQQSLKEKLKELMLSK